MTLTERERLMRQLDEILERTETVRFELAAIARRDQTVPSSWSLERLDALADAARSLVRATDKVPLSPE